MPRDRRKATSAKKQAYRSVAVALAIVLAGLGLSIQLSTEAEASPETPLNLAILWHMHQPLYKNILTGKYEMPWVRDHAATEYLDHPKILMQHPSVNLTFNLVPSLILQIEDYVAGAEDNHIELARINLAAATPEERRLMAQEFIRLAPWYYTRNTTDGQILNPWYDTYAAWPRLNFLVGQVSLDPLSLNDTELQDLETIYFLHQVSIPYVEGQYDIAERNDTIIQLLEKGTGYTQADTETVLSYQRATMAEVVGFYKDAQDLGQAEIITTPFYHPIAPLLMESVVPAEDAIHNVTKGVWENDTRYQYINASDFYEARFGQSAEGVWHSEQAVSPSVIPAAVDAGFNWTSSDEGVLWQSEVGGQLLAESAFNRTRVYTATEAGRTIDIVFRDTDISNRVSFTYGGLPTDEAVTSFMDILDSYYQNLTEAQRQDGLVTLAADGENWMFMAGYPNDGRDFLNALYENLSQAQVDGWLQTWRIGDFLAQPGLMKVPLSSLHAGSWIDADFRTWSGEEEEQVGWARLVAAREAVVQHTVETEGRDFVDPVNSTPAVKRAWEAILTAEGSDWFWWYGDDQSSGDDGRFDVMLKAHLITAYESIGQPPPVDIVAEWGSATPPDQEGAVTEESLPPTLDGVASTGEWTNATAWYGAAPGGLMQLREFYAHADAGTLYLRIDLNGDATVLRGDADRDVDIYLSYPVRVAERDMEVNLNRYGINFQSKLGDFTFNWSARYRLSVVLEQALSTGVTPWSLFSAGEGPDHLGDGTWTFQASRDNGGFVGSIIELLLPLADVEYGPGDLIRMAVVTADGGSELDILPVAGPGEVRALIPSPGPPVAIFEDPVGDDTGDGDYTYATAPDFKCSDGTHCEDYFHDITYFNISDAPTSITFTLSFVDVGFNQWSGPNGFSYGIMNIYIDSDRVPGSGNLQMLEGANAEVTSDFAWEAAIQAAGWSDSRTFVTGNPQVTQRLQTGLLVRRVPETMNIEITVPKTLLETVGVTGDPRGWGYVVVAGAQDGFGPGWWRPIGASAATWVGGGAGQPGIPPGFHSRIYDAITADGVNQSAALASYTPNTVAKVPGVIVEIKRPGVPTVTVDPDPPWSKDDTISVSWSAEPNPETARPIESYDVAAFHTAENVLLDLVGTALTQAEFEVTLEENITIRVTAHDGLATSLPFVQEYEVTKSPPPPPDNQRPLLTNPGVEPTEGDERTNFVFTVRYVDPDGDAPEVSLVMGGDSKAMSWVGGSNRTGAFFRISLVLPAGNHTYKFSADDRNGTVALTYETEEFFLVVRGAGLPVLVVVGISAGGAVAAIAVVAYVLLRRRTPQTGVQTEGEETSEESGGR